MTTPVGDSYNTTPGGFIAAGRSYYPSWAPVAGEIKSISLNTLADIDPKNDPLANPNYPGSAPWESSAAWIHCLDYGSAVIADDLGSLGSLLFYAAAGHSACSPTMWCRYDLATRQWSRHGKRSLPNDAMASGLSGYPGVLDSTWGDYDGAASTWGAFAQPGYNPPAGSHAYAGYAYRPANKAGNLGGEVIWPMNPTGATAGTTARGSWVWDCDTGLFARSANLRPEAGGSTVGGTQYFPALDAAFALNTLSSLWLARLDWFDCQTKMWTRRASQNGAYYANLTGIAFAHQAANLYIVCCEVGGVLKFWAAPVDKAVSGTAWDWTELTVTNTSGVAAPTTSWCWHPDKGCWYGVDGLVGSHYLYKLVAPSNDQAAALSGTWTITREVLAGEALYCKSATGVDAAVDDYRFLNFSTKAHCLLWISPYVGGVVQALRPGT